MDLYLKQNKYKTISVEEKIDYIKLNKSRLILPVDELSNKHLDLMLSDIKNNWNKYGYQYHKMVEQWYDVLLNKNTT